MLLSYYYGAGVCSKEKKGRQKTSRPRRFLPFVTAVKSRISIISNSPSVFPTDYKNII